MSLFQEDLCVDPFWMLVACALVNQTSWRAAQPVFQRVRHTWPTPLRLTMSRTYLVRDVVRSLGLQNRRAELLRELARVYCESPPKTAEDVAHLPGCGKYAADSWAIFVEGRRDRVPTDKELIGFLERERADSRRLIDEVEGDEGE